MPCDLSDVIKLPVAVVLMKRFADFDSIVILLAKRLFEKLDGIILRVESFSGFDGSNVRIVVSDKSDHVVDKILEVIGEVERTLGIAGRIIPDIVTPDECLS